MSNETEVGLGEILTDDVPETGQTDAAAENLPVPETGQTDAAAENLPVPEGEAKPEKPAKVLKTTEEKAAAISSAVAESWKNQSVRDARQIRRGCVVEWIDKETGETKNQRFNSVEKAFRFFGFDLNRMYGLRKELRLKECAPEGFIDYQNGEDIYRFYDVEIQKVEKAPKPPKEKKAKEPEYQKDESGNVITGEDGKPVPIVKVKKEKKAKKSAAVEATKPAEEAPVDVADSFD